MAGRSIVDQEFLLGAETTPGTAQTSQMRRYGSLRAMPGWEGEGDVFLPQGFRVPTVVIPPEETGSWSLEGIQDFNVIGAVLASRFGLPSSDQPDASGAPSAYRHAFALIARGSSTRRTYTAQWGDNAQAVQAVFGVFNSFGLSVQRGELGLETSFVSRAPQTGISLAATNEVQTVTITGSPTGGTFTLTFRGATTAPIAYNATAAQVQSALQALATIGAGNVTCGGGPLPASAVTVTFTGALGRTNVPVMTAASSLTGGTSPTVTVTETTPGNPQDIAAIPIPTRGYDIYADDSWAALGTTKLLACYQANINLGDRFVPDSPINSAVTSFDDLLEQPEQEASVEIQLGFDATAVALMNTFVAGSKKFLRWRVEGPTIGGAVKYLFQFDCCVLIRSRGQIAQAPNSPAVVVPFAATIAADDVSGFAARATVINTVPSY